MSSSFNSKVLQNIILQQQYKIQFFIISYIKDDVFLEKTDEIPSCLCVYLYVSEDQESMMKVSECCRVKIIHWWSRSICIVIISVVVNIIPHVYRVVIDVWVINCRLQLSTIITGSCVKFCSHAAAAAANSSGILWVVKPVVNILQWWWVTIWWRCCSIGSVIRVCRSHGICIIQIVLISC